MPRSLLVVALASLLPARSWADEEPGAARRWFEAIELHGLVDTYYGAGVGQAQDAAVSLRAFDGPTGFELAYVKLGATRPTAGPFSVGFRAEAGFGPTAGVLAYERNPGISSTVVEQAFASLALPGGVVVDAGRFDTTAGAEVIEAKDNWLYSRSLLFTFATPFTHTGIRAGAPVPGIDGLQVVLMLHNGWDNPPRAVDHHETGHLFVSYSGPSSTTLGLNVMYGRNPWEPRPRLLVDLAGSRAFGTLALSLEATYGAMGAARYWVVAGMARYSIVSDHLRVAVRGEYFDDADGLQLGGGPFFSRNRYYEATLGLAVPVATGAEVRLEARQDRVTDGLFPSSHSHQTTLQLAVLAWF